MFIRNFILGVKSWRQEKFSDGKNITDNFESWNVTKFSWGIEEELAEIVNGTLQVLYPAGSYSPSKARGGLGFYASPIYLDNSQKVTLQYKVKFSPGFDFVKGGKLPGLYGGSTTCSGGADSEDCFSTRFMWRREGDLEVYGYFPNNQVEGFCDDSDVLCNFDHGHSLGRGVWRFVPGEWVTIAQVITLNTVGSMDGTVAVLVEGEELYRREQLNIRQSQEVVVQGIMFSTFYGGSDSSWAPGNDTWAYFDYFSLVAQ